MPGIAEVLRTKMMPMVQLCNLIIFKLFQIFFYPVLVFKVLRLSLKPG